MKPPAKSKSPEVSREAGRRVSGSPRQLTSTTTKKDLPRTRSTISEKVNGKNVNISGVSPISEKSPITRTYANSRQIFAKGSVTPKITISKCAQSYIETAFNVKKKSDGNSLQVEATIGPVKRSPKNKPTVLRKKIKSPLHSNKPLPKSSKETFIKPGKPNDLDVQLKRKTIEIAGLERKINNLQKLVSDRDKKVKELELKLPRMLNDVKKMEAFSNKRNVGNLKRQEGQLNSKGKDTRLKEAEESKKAALDQLKSIEKESKELFRKLICSEKTVEEVKMKLDEKTDELNMAEEKILFLEHRLKSQFDENFERIKKLEEEISRIKSELRSRESEVLVMNEHNEELRSELEEQYSTREKMEEEIKQYIDVIDGIKNNLDKTSSNEINRRSIDLDQATEDFLEKVSTVSKKKNVTVNLKLTVKKTKLNETLLDRSQFLGSELCSPFINSTRRLSDNFPKELLEEMTPVKVTEFEDLEDMEMSMDLEDLKMSMEDRENDSIFEQYSEASSDFNYTVSSATYERFEALDQGVKNLWDRVSVRNTPLDKSDSEQVKEFTKSVEKLKNDLDQSLRHHDSFLQQVSVAKRLFM